MLIGDKVVLRDKSISDAANDYAWRCDADLCRLDAVLPLVMPYREYVSYYVDELRYPARRRRKFAIDSIEDGRHIGNCMYYDIDEDGRQAELGIMIGDKEYWGRGYGSDAVETLVRHVFDKTGIDRLHLKTLDWNVRARRCFEKCGFVPCGRTSRQGYDFIVMEVHRGSPGRPRSAAGGGTCTGVEKTTLPHST